MHILILSSARLPLTLTPGTVRRFADLVRQRIRLDGGGYRRDHLRAFAQRVEVGETEFA